MVPNTVRQPYPTVLVNGQGVGGIIEADIESNSFFSADRFRIRAALFVPEADVWSTVNLLVEIRLSLGGEEASLITGTADSVTIDPIRGEIQIAGRDLASVFVGAQSDQSFENQTSSDIATLLAARHGLNAQVATTTSLIGRYYQNGRTRTTMTQHARATTEWDLLCWLAQLEGFDVWVNGTTLYFQPVVQAAPGVTLTPQDCTSMTLHHALDIAAGVTVTVKSWDCVAQNGITQSASSGGGSDPGIVRTVVRPNLSAGDAQSLATRILTQIQTHERHVDLEMPGDLATSPRMVLSLADTGTAFDGLYDICSVHRRISFSRGYSQTIEARSLPWTPSSI
jgi:phage protein D